MDYSYTSRLALVLNAQAEGRSTVVATKNHFHQKNFSFFYLRQLKIVNLDQHQIPLLPPEHYAAGTVAVYHVRRGNETRAVSSSDFIATLEGGALLVHVKMS